MSINSFKLERYFALYEFKVKYLLSPSDCESLSMAELLEMASPASLKLWQELKLGYTESPGHPRLREEVAALYHDISADQVIIAVPEEAIYIAMQALLSPGDHVVTVSPAYQSLYEVARSIGCEVTPWKYEPGAGGWQVDIARLESSITPRTRLIVTNSPHNPTGALFSLDDQKKIIEIARKHDLYIFSDEMYRMLEHDPEKRLPAMCEAYEKGISLSGLSKAYALPGLRVGWLVTQESALIDRWLAFKDYTTICNSAPGEVLGIIALQAKETILKRNIEIVRRSVQIAEKFFGENGDRFTWIAPQAGSIAFPLWRGEGTVESFCQNVLEREGVMIVPGSIFEYPGNHFRVGLGRKNFGEALEHVQAYLQSRG